MVKKKKTKVVMPAGLTNLTHSVQRGNVNAPAAEIEPQDTDEQDEQDELSVQEDVALPETEDDGRNSSAPAEPERQPTDYEYERSTARQTPQTSRFGHVSPKQEASDRKNRTAPAAKKLPKAEGRQLAREYSLAKDSGEDSWQIFLDLARDYKARDSRLATVYIDSDLKGVLDRLKSATSVKLPSTALLSAIVARFVFEHEKDIKNAIFGESLL